MNHLGDTNKKVKPETYMTIYADGRITVSDKLKPDETAARVLECMQTQFLGDAQATKIRELQDRIKRLEEALEGTVKRFVTLANSGDAGFWNPEEESAIIAARAALKKEDNL